MATIGSLRYDILIEYAVETQNAYGEPVTTWTEFATVWGSKEDLGGREFFLAQQTLSKATTKFVIRWIEGLASKMRVTVDGVSYDVISVADVDGRKRFLTLLGVRNG